MIDDSQRLQNRVQHPVVRVEDPFPQHSIRDRCDGPGDDEQHAQNPKTPEAMIEQQSSAQAEDRHHHDFTEGKDNCTAERRKESVVGEESLVVCPADPMQMQVTTGQPHMLHRQNQRPQDRIAENGYQYGQRRSHEEQPNPTAPLLEGARHRSGRGAHAGRLAQGD